MASVTHCCESFNGTEREAMGALSSPHPAIGMGGPENAADDDVLLIEPCCPEHAIATSTTEPAEAASRQPPALELFVPGTRPPDAGCPQPPCLADGSLAAPPIPRPSGAYTYHNAAGPLRSPAFAAAAPFDGDDAYHNVAGFVRLPVCCGATRSPFAWSAASAGDAPFVAYHEYTTLVLYLGHRGHLSSSLDAGSPSLSDCAIAQSIAHRTGCLYQPTGGSSMWALWQWLQRTALLLSEPGTVILECCGGCPNADRCPGRVLRVAVLAARPGPASATAEPYRAARGPNLRAGSWPVSDICLQWPPPVARELATFCWPIDSVPEFVRLLGCRNARPVAIFGGEFTGATRDAYIARHRRVGVSVDLRRPLTHGPHAILDLADVLFLAVWLDAFLFPPCTHQVLSDTRAAMAKRLDGRTFWGIALFIFCWCVHAHRVLVEQPDTIIPDYVLAPSQRLRPCDLGDDDNKPINLFSRGRLPVAVADQALQGRSGHGELRDFADAEERDRWRSSWARHPRLAHAATFIPPSQLDADAELGWRWMAPGLATETSGRRGDGLAPLVWVVAPPLEAQPCFLVMMEAFAVAWYQSGFPVPHDYLNGRPSPSDADARAYQQRRGSGDGRRIRGVVPVSLRETHTDAANFTPRTGALLLLTRPYSAPRGPFGRCARQGVLPGGSSHRAHLLRWVRKPGAMPSNIGGGDGLTA